MQHDIVRADQVLVALRAISAESDGGMFMIQRGTSIAGAAALLFFIVGAFLFSSTASSISSRALNSSHPAGNFATIMLSEVLSNPQKDWDQDGDTGSANQWIELANTSTGTIDISHLELLSHGSNSNQPAMLSSSAQAGPSGFFVIFVDRVNAAGVGGFHLFSGGGQLDMIDGDTGATLDSVNYPALGSDLSYMRTASGSWSITGTPTPGTANIFTIPGSPTPKPTHTAKPSATPRSGKGGSGSGTGGTPTATPFPVGSVVLPTNTTLASQQSDSSLTSSGGSETNASFPSWLKIVLLVALGVGLFAVLIWYIRSWSHEP
jgi:hypothetical protein